MRLAPAILAAFVLLPSAYSQEFRGKISGSVTDPTGAAIAEARVTVVETATRTRVESRSDSSGHYVVPFLLPGTYDLSVKFEGFKEVVRRAIPLGAGDAPIIDVRLEVGETQQSVEVTAEVPLINNDNASVGQSISTKEVENLPTNGGTPMMLASFAMGVISTSQPSQVLPFASGGAASWSISGAPNQTSELLMDGVPDATWDGRLAYSPPQDAVQEVRVKAFDTDAGYGHTAGGTANTVLKSGGNDLHGAVYEKNQPNNLVANNFFNNKSGLATQVTHFNQYGVVAGGPVLVPKVFNGKNRLFWFFAFEGLKSSSPNATFLSVPTEAERAGDFSKLLTVSSPTVLYDPATAVKSGSTITRTAFAGNKIPTSRMNPVALKYLAYIPAANVTNVVRADDYNNFGNNNTTTDGYTNELGRLDYNFSANNRTYFNIRHTDYYQTKNNYFSNIATGSNLSRNNWGSTLDHVYMLNAANVVNVRLNYTRMFEDHSAPSQGFDATELGFPSYIAGTALYPQMPYIQFNSNTNFTALGTNGANTLPSQSFQMFGTWVAIRGAHSIKVGADLRQYRLNYRAYGAATGSYTFGNTWVRASSSASSTVSMGQDFASFLLGLPTGGQYDINTSASFYSYYAAGFVQDDWRVRRNLTLNLGLRFDHDFPYHEKWGRSVNGFDYTSSNPLEAAAQTAYAKSPSALLPAADFKVRGGLTFASPGDNALYQNTSHLWSPRVGLAWSPDRFSGKLVVRTGFALFVAPINLSTLQISGAYSTNPLLTQEGFSQSTTFTPSNDSYLTPAGTLSSPYPTGISQPSGSSNGLLTYAGQNVNFLNPEMKSPYSVRWNVGVQYALSPNSVVEVAYIGSHAVHLPITYTGLNPIPRNRLSTMGTRDQTLISALTGTIANPFLGLKTSTGTNTTVSVAQVLARYPQFPVGFSSGNSSPSTGVYMQNLTEGSSIYHSLNVRYQRRVSKGISVMANFMQSKTIEQTIWRDVTDSQPERRVSPFFRPTRLASAVTYSLPVGRGRYVALRSRWLDAIAGGWNLTASYLYQAGGPLMWVNGSTSVPGDYVYFGGQLNPNPRNVDTTAFNTSVFDTKSANQFQYHIRTFSTTFGNLRADGINEWNGSLLKNFNFHEGKYLQLRCEAFNMVNHPTFAAANTTATNSVFGTITSQANRPRMMQLVARIVF
jgi:hypothetical protein